jgi:hypothetical protein
MRPCRRHRAVLADSPSGACAPPRGSDKRAGGASRRSDPPTSGAVLAGLCLVGDGGSPRARTHGPGRHRVGPAPPARGLTCSQRGSDKWSRRASRPSAVLAALWMVGACSLRVRTNGPGPGAGASRAFGLPLASFRRVGSARRAFRTSAQGVAGRVRPRLRNAARFGRAALRLSRAHQRLPARGALRTNRSEACRAIARRTRGCGTAPRARHRRARAAAALARSVRATPASPRGACREPSAIAPSSRLPFGGRLGIFS